MKYVLYILILFFGCITAVFAEEGERAFLENSVQTPKFKELWAKNTRIGNLRRARMLNQTRLDNALSFIKKRNYLEGVKKLFILSQLPAFKKRRAEIRFILGKTFMELKLFHAASFQFISVIETGSRKYIHRSLQHISKIAALTGDRKILQFAIKKGGIKNLKGEYRNSLYYQFGKYKLKERNYKEAVFYLRKISRHSSLYEKARYNLGLAYAEMNQTKKAISAFKDMLSRPTYLTDPLRTSALLGIARVYYQARKWNSAVYFYRQIPKDTPAWHDMLTENSWALLRAGKFRSAMNSFHTLHSSYYKNRYQPESFLLRAIIYMYICKYDEMEKMLNVFNVMYSPVRKWVNKKASRSSRNLYNNVIQAVESQNSVFPKAIALRIFRENDFQLLYKYLNHLKKEQAVITSFPFSWRASRVGKYSLKLVNTRLKTSMNQVNVIIQRHLKDIRREMKDFFNQEQYLRYESLRGKRTQIKKKISKKYLGNIKVIENTSRDYFVQNGFEFWPFDGEYWLDELGNYHYVGIQNCK